MPYGLLQAIAARKLAIQGCSLSPRFSPKVQLGLYACLLSAALCLVCLTFVVFNSLFDKLFYDLPHKARKISCFTSDSYCSRYASLTLAATKCMLNAFHTLGLSATAENLESEEHSKNPTIDIFNYKTISALRLLYTRIFHSNCLLE